ncbi:MAG: M18 family aminopeptidase [Chromatocurvus sp.]
MNSTEFNSGLCDFLSRATTPFHAVAAMTAALREAGFEPLDDAGQGTSTRPGGRYYLTRNDSSLVAFTHGTEHAPRDGMHMVGAHTDSPCLMVKPNPERLRQGCYQLGVEVYGGALLNPWFDRDLSLAGRVSYADERGDLATGLVDFRTPMAVIPSLAIHLDREANSNRSVNPQTDILPLLSLAGEGEEPALRDLLAATLKESGHPLSRVLDYELCFYDVQPPALVGLKREFIASARLDNLLSCYTGLQALLAADPAHSALLVCNDHEEVGSTSAVGAQGPMLRSVLMQLAGDEQAFARMLDRSVMISADNAHAVHPNFADRHDERHGPRMNAGPVIKHNANQRYATSSETAGLYRLLAEQEGVPVQSFVVRSDMGCGSTIGLLTAAGLGVRTLDIGVPTLAMHSVRELAGSEDACSLWRVLRRFYGHPRQPSTRSA